MRNFRTLLGAGIAGLCVAAGLPSVALAAPAAPYTVFTVDLGDHRPFPMTTSAVYDDSNATMSVTADANDLLYLQATDLPTVGYAAFVAQPPTGQRWVEGQTYAAARLQDATLARLELGSNHNGCNQTSGSLTIKDLDRDGETQVLTSFAASYRFTCENFPQAVTGEVRWNSSVDYVAALTAPASVDFGTREVASPVVTRTVTVTAAGSVPSVFGATTIEGPVPGLFSVAADTCTGRTVQPGGTCTVTVAANVIRDGEQTAQLLVADNTVGGRRVVPLKVTGQRGAAGTYYPAAPARLMDTRSGLGAPKAKIGAARTVDLQVTGRGGVPSTGVGSVVLNVTVTGPTANSYLTAYPAGEARPTASSINFPKGWLGSNNVTVKVGTGGKVSVYNHTGSTDVVVDVVGYYAKDNSIISSRGIGGHYQWFKPSRLFDTRERGGVLPGGYYTDGGVDFGPAFSPSVQAVVLNITAVSPTRAGFLTAWSGEGDVPTASTVNYAAGKVVPNLAVVKTRQIWNSDGYYMPAFAVYTSQTTHVVVDLVGVMDNGYQADGLRFIPMSPTRIADSRIGQGTPAALPPGGIRKITAPAGLVTDATEVLAMNVTAVAPTSNTVLTVWPADTTMTKPTASNLNPAAGQTVSNGVLGVIGPQDAFNVYNHAGTTHLVADVVGTFYLYPGTASSATVAEAMRVGAERVVQPGDRVVRRG